MTFYKRVCDIIFVLHSKVRCDYGSCGEITYLKTVFGTGRAVCWSPVAHTCDSPCDSEHTPPVPRESRPTPQKPVQLMHDGLHEAALGKEKRKSRNSENIVYFIYWNIL